MINSIKVSVNEERLRDDLNTLAGFSASSPEGGVTRRAWSKEFRAAKEWLTERFDEAGLVTEVDAAGNIWGKWATGDLPAIVVGSHIDSVPSGGQFDGCLGVLGGLEAVRSLQEVGFIPRRQIWVVAWTEEEGSAFGAALFGSRAFVGLLNLDTVQHLKNDEGEKLRSVVEADGHEWTDLEKLSDRLTDISAYLELHIEQGPMLEKQGIPIGVVTHIVGMECGHVRLNGMANHAGGTPMDHRQDAAVGAAHAILAARDLAIERGVRATTGQLSVRPGAMNVIAGQAEFSIDARHHDSAVLARYIADLTHEWLRIGDTQGLDVEYTSGFTLEPVPLDERLQEHLRQTCIALSVESRDMVSGAGHDAMVLAPQIPSAMLFVPSRAGISHSREEFTEPADCAEGARVLAHTLAGLSHDWTS
jgi:allantoate deiminase